MTRATILIPAHDEATVIDRTLLHLSRGMAEGDFHIVIIANGCSDATASKARASLPCATVIETATAGKAHALNLGYAAADKDRPVICLDADLDITAESLTALLQPICEGRAQAACGQMQVRACEASALVRAYYGGWWLNPYFDSGKFGGVFALSPAAAAGVFPLPAITADDEYVRRSVGPDQTAYAPACRFTARAPKTLRGLVQVRRRAIRGAREVGRLGLATPERGSRRVLIGRVIRRPARLVPFAVYATVNLFVRAQLAFERPAAASRWERDATTRAAG